MEITYVRPLDRGFQRMRQVLFAPFDLGKWLVIGFSCWLAELLSGSGGSGGGWQFSDDWGKAEAALASGGDLGPEWVEGLLTGIALWVILLAVVTLLVLVPVLLWLSSRGRFLFLDNVVHGRGAVKLPWREYRREGNSLFLWSLGFFFAALAAVVLAAAPALAYAVSHEELGWGMVPGLLGFLLLPLLVIVAICYVELFLVHFVVPIMFRERLTTMAAWRRFLPVFRNHAGHFLLYGLFVLLLWLLVAAVVIAFGFATCCIGWLLLCIPYLGTVVMLPVYVTFRALSLAFLGQFSPDWDLLAGAAPGEPALPPPAPAV